MREAVPPSEERDQKKPPGCQLRHHLGRLAFAPVWYHARHTKEHYAHLCPVHQHVGLPDAYVTGRWHTG